MHAIDVLLKKRDGLELSTAEIEFFVRAVVSSGEAGDSRRCTHGGSQFGGDDH